MCNFVLTSVLSQLGRVGGAGGALVPRSGDGAGGAAEEDRAQGGEEAHSEKRRTRVFYLMPIVSARATNADSRRTERPVHPPQSALYADSLALLLVT